MPDSSALAIGSRLLSRLRSVVAAGCAALLVLAVMVVALVARTAPAGAVTTRSDAVHNAAAYGAAHGYHVGIAVLDTQTGRLYHAGAYNGTFASESVVKVMIVARLFNQNRMYGYTKARAYKMITQSDDAIASSFYGSVGGDALIDWVKSYYRVPDLGHRPTRAGWWGNTYITPDGLAEFYAKLKANHRVAPWLLYAMHHATEHGSDGFYQWFGLHSANPYAATKQGWGTDYSDWGRSADENTTGFVDADRYAVAILARAPVSTYGAQMGSMLTAVARLLLPGGQFPAAAPVVRYTRYTTGRSTGGSPLTLYGTDLQGTYAVLFGTQHALSLHVLSSTAISMITPPHWPGSVLVRVYSSHGESSLYGPHFTYVNPPEVTRLSTVTGPPAGGTVVTLTGWAMTRVHEVYVGGVPAKILYHPTRESMTIVTPAHTAGAMYIRVSTDYGLSAIGPANRFVYIAAPPPAARKTSPSTSAPSSSVPSSSVPSSSVPSSSVPSSSAPVTPAASPAPASTASDPADRISGRAG